MTIAAIGKDVKDISELATTAATTGSARVVAAIKSAAQKTGVDFSYLMQKAETESSLNPAAKAKGSSATGLFQFVNQTWIDTLDKHAAEMGRSDIARAIQHNSSGHAYVADAATRQKILALRSDPELSATMAGALTQDNADCLKAQLGQNCKVGGTELYLAHFLGAGGAGDFLEKMKSNPNVPAASVLPQAAAANHSIFYSSGGRALSVSEVYNHFASKFGGSSEVVTEGAGDVGETTEVAAATKMAMATLNGTGHSRGFAAFTGSADNDGAYSGTDNIAPAAASYVPVDPSHLSANGDVYSFGSRPASAATNAMTANASVNDAAKSMSFALWMADHGGLTGKNDGPGNHLGI